MKSGNFGGSRNMGGPYGGGILYVLTCPGTRVGGFFGLFGEVEGKIQGVTVLKRVEGRNSLR